MSSNKNNTDNHIVKLIRYIKTHEDDNLNNIDEYISIQKDRIIKNGLIKTY